MFGREGGGVGGGEGHVRPLHVRTYVTILLLHCITISSLLPYVVSSLSPSSANEPPNMGKVMMGMPMGMGMGIGMPPPKLPPRLQTIRSSQLKLHLPGGGTVKLPSADATK